MANQIRNLPDSIKKLMKYYKIKLDSFQRNNSSDFLAKKDSLVKIINIVSRLDTGLIGRGKNIGNVYKKFNSEFPEYIKLSKEERSKVFKKATALYLSNETY